ncbi:MAG: sigma-54-dependent Fis family transcriptional regulator [Candidatus Omnitrophica bacterium]|nr:sigma-54-dependent Fis family transcriptional regulator [Candidatus Omnitrophota bacterium]
MKKANIVVIDDEANICQMLEEALQEEGFLVESFQNPKEGLAAVSKKMPDLVITDLVMPELDGLELIKRIKGVHPEINIVVITAHASLDSAIGAIRAGASDYLVKPFKIADLKNSVQKALSQKRLIPETFSHDKSFQERYEVKNLIGITPEIKEVYRLVEKTARLESSILIVGESGTGKEVVARAVHYHSKRRKGPFVSINCAALPETLLESELFGYEKGAFTGAAAFKVGLFELASGGTFFLDEVGETSPMLQVKLLRVLQERVLKRVGGVKDIPVDFRLIAATSKNLFEEMKAGRFREDFFYRLNVIPIVLPPLRERTEDIPLFVAYFLEHFAKKSGLDTQYQITEEALEVLRSYEWPGNIRELENVIERLIALAESAKINGVLAREAIKGVGFSLSFQKPISKESDLKETLESYERDLIAKAIEKAHGNQNQAAKKLNLTRQALHYKIKKYGIKQ